MKNYTWMAATNVKLCITEKGLIFDKYYLILSN